MFLDHPKSWSLWHLRSVNGSIVLSLILEESPMKYWEIEKIRVVIVMIGIFKVWYDAIIMNLLFIIWFQFLDLISILFMHYTTLWVFSSSISCIVYDLGVLWVA